MPESPTLGRGMAQELLEVQRANGFHQDVKSQSTTELDGAGRDRTCAPPRQALPEAFSVVVFVSRAMNELLAGIARASDGQAPMLITGETGAGKGLIAHAVHDASGRRGREFVTFDCGSAPPELVASELFGHRRGAFTGAERDYEGVIRAADGGTLFLDEIGELPLAEQPKLLRFLQEGEVRPLGEARAIKVNVRVIAATNRDLEADVRAGRFREDLYYRLNVLRFHIPPLRQRREDIRPLLDHFLDLRWRETGKHSLLSEEAWALLLSHDWPGNAREVDNFSQRLAALAANGETIGRELAQAALTSGVCAPPTTSAIIAGKFVIDAKLPHRERMKECERLSIAKDLKEAGGNITRAARTLGMSRNGLKSRIERLGIDIENFGHQTEKCGTEK